jgi:hypothetical protein
MLATTGSSPFESQLAAAAAQPSRGVNRSARLAGAGLRWLELAATTNLNM